MNARKKSALLLLATLVIGGLVGAVITGAVVNNRLDQLRGLRERGGFSERIEQVIQPTDAAQEAEIRAVLGASHERFEAMRRRHREEFSAHRDTLRADLAPLLTPDQQARLDEWFARDRTPRRRRRPPTCGTRAGSPSRTSPTGWV